jgi:hypothetical protein
MRGKNFDGYITPEARIKGAIHFAHAASAQRFFNLIRPEFRASGEPHGGWNYMPENKRSIGRRRLHRGVSFAHPPALWRNGDLSSAHRAAGFR